jgi:hypothetical protein
MRAMFPVVLVVTASTLFACGGVSSGGGSGSVSGEVASTSFTVSSALGSRGPNTSSSCESSPDGGTKCTTSSSGDTVAIILTNVGSLTCSLVDSDISGNKNVNYASADALILGVAKDTGALTPDTYQIVDPTENFTSGAAAQLSTTTATCGSGLSIEATSGSITLSALTSTGATGSYDVTFGTAGSQGSYKGTFDVTFCAIPDAGNTVTDNTDAAFTQPACMK